jgi:hypothetical protein
MCIHPAFLRHDEDEAPAPDVEAPPVEPAATDDERETTAEEVLVNA